MDESFSPKDSPSKRHVSQPFVQKLDVYSRLYNDAQRQKKPIIRPQVYSRTNPAPPPPPTHYNNGPMYRNNGHFQSPSIQYRPSPHNFRPQPPPSSHPSPHPRVINNRVILDLANKVADLQQLFHLIHEEDPQLFNDNDNDYVTYTEQEPKQSQDVFQDYNESNNSLDIYERGEVLRRKDDIYFLPNRGQDRQINIRNYNTNYGFDDNRGNYVVIPHDHINFRYEIESVLGNGSFGNVVKCADNKYLDNSNRHKTVAIKIIKNDLNWSLQAVYEIKMLQHLNEPSKRAQSGNTNTPYLQEYGYNQCPVLNYYDHFHFRGHMCIVTEPLSLNLYSLLEVIKFQGLSLPLIKLFTKKILLGLQFIHKQNVLHCDIKPENIMIKVPTPFDPENISDDSLIVKIVDFGTSCFNNEITYSYIQSRFYRAPEVILGAKYNHMIDIWSLGCVIAELFTGNALLPGKNELEQIGFILELFGGPNSNLILQQRKTLMKSIKTKTSTAKFNDDKFIHQPTDPKLLKLGTLADEKAIKKTLLYTLFDMEGKINMQFLNIRIQAANQENPNFSSNRKLFKIASKSLDLRLKIRSPSNDKKLSAQFLKFLNSIFVWDPNQRATADDLLLDPFIVSE